MLSTLFSLKFPIFIALIHSLSAFKSTFKTIKNLRNNHLILHNTMTPTQSTSVNTPSIEILKSQLRERIATLTTGGWFAIGAIDTFNEKLPFDITIADNKLAVWNNPLDKDNLLTGGWSVMLDVCPHRLAPLSQGRVDPGTGCIECPYHGHQFESGGKDTSQFFMFLSPFVCAYIIV